MGLPMSKDHYYNFSLLCFLQFGTLDWVLRFSADTFYFFGQILRKYDCKSLSVSGRESERLLQCIIKRGADFEEVLQVVQLMDGLHKVDAFKFYIQVMYSGDPNSGLVRYLIGPNLSDH